MKIQRRNLSFFFESMQVHICIKNILKYCNRYHMWKFYMWYHHLNYADELCVRTLLVFGTGKKKLLKSGQFSEGNKLLKLDLSTYFNSKLLRLGSRTRIREGRSFFRKYNKIIHNYKTIKVNYQFKLECYEYMKLLIFKIK
jgi:hypothetical protein